MGRPVTSYVGTLFATMLVLAVAAVALGIWADPYRFFGTSAVPHWTLLKPRAYEESDMAKSYQLLRIAPRTLILGNSRAEVGIDPESKQWPVRLKPVFNAAEAGHDLFSALLFLQDDLALKPPTLVVIGLDFQDFIQSGNSSEDPPRGPNEFRLLVDRNGLPNPSRGSAWWSDAFHATLTITAVDDALLTLAQQDERSSVTMTAAGFNPLREYQSMVMREGAYSLFTQKEAAYEAQYSHFSASDFQHPETNPEFRYLDKMLAAAGAHNCNVVLFIYPYHARYLEMLRRLGLWESFEAWKRAVVHVVSKHSQILSSNKVELFDFSDYNEFTEEDVPRAGDTHTQLRWYWEPGHFKSALGDRVIARVLGHDETFGRKLSSSNVEKVLSEINADREKYLKDGQVSTIRH